MKWLVLPSCDEEFNGARLLIVRVRCLREKKELILNGSRSFRCEQICGCLQP